MDKNILSKITKWLEDEMKHNEPILNESEKLSDDTFDIHLGRNECATSLLEQIEKWKEENEV
tara:strand:- start:4118 stop:4303 length:186 start_codon:yes stop_codon:yes gene_type:complete